MRRYSAVLAVIPILLSTCIFLGNTNLLVTRQPGKPVLLAHRGMAQRFDTKDLDNDTCTATRMLPPRHGYLENTIDSMRAAFAAGADIVELDVHPTTDGQFAVFHDWTLDCRTEGKGVTREHTMAEMKRLDIGYGYTADGGKTYPFRGKGIGMMPSLDEVLTGFPGRSFIINVKSNDREEGKKLGRVLGQLPPARRGRFLVYGGDEPIAEVRRLLPEIKTMARASLKSCLIRYIGYGWTGIVPESCENLAVLVPSNIAPWLWGWPDRFLNRMDAAGSQVFLTGPYSGGGFSSGIDTAEDLAQIPEGYSGGIWTNEIEEVAKLIRSRSGN